MSHTLRIIVRAREDVDGMFAWLARRSARGAVAWYIAFRHAAERITAAPEASPLAPESNRLGHDVRQALFGTRRGRIYRIVFRVVGEEVVVLRVRGPGQAPLRRRDVSGG